jgi:hypothetical protein
LYAIEILIIDSHTAKRWKKLKNSTENDTFSAAK